ncbi:MAG TPA: S9 family peptidase [Longimicrobiales bacterium]|nr:S9 family peptidase [Longimicrobiales bacterium]
MWLLLLLLLLPLPLEAQKRPLRVNDIYRVRSVRDPERSPDGKWVAYTLSTTDSARDRSNTDVWMVSWDGQQNLRLTFTDENESSPRWSPDGRYLSFTSSRQGARGGQVWLLDRRGGEAQKLTDLRPGVSSYAWSPDSKRLLFVMGDVDPNESRDTSSARPPRPIVIDRHAFKRDGSGYLRNLRQHLYLYTLETRKLDTLTVGRFDENQASWSPDGRLIAFVSERTDDPDRTNNADVFVMEARPGAQPRQLTTSPGPDGGPLAWSPDSRFIAYTQGSEPQYSAYMQNRLAVIPVSGGAPRVLTAELDRPVSSPVFSRDGRWVYFLATDDRARYIARVPASGGAIEPLTHGRRVINSLAEGPDESFAVLAATATTFPEILAFENRALRPLTHQNDSLLAELQLGTTEDVSFKSKDGTVVNGLLVKPAAYRNGEKLPMLLRIHGGPNGQDQHELSFERELFAANGYAVLAVNYRGSNGRGEAYQRAIFADWGNLEVQDLLAGVDHVVGMGVADPDRLGIGGWSYGGILTDYTIATTTRFKAAISGAGSALQLSMYGSDQYIYQYENEVGPPWKNQDTWIKLSYPFFHADRITTPTLFLGGERDFNVPIIGSEQMYQALRSLNVPTELVIYPGEYHGISRPSFQRDRLERYLSWYAKYLKPTTSADGVLK